MINKPVITGTRYVLAVKDLVKSAAWYEEKLGFKTWLKVEGWQFLYRDKFLVMLGHCPDQLPAFELGDHSYFAYIDIEGVDELYHEYKTNGVEILSPPVDQVWEQREFAIRTIDGHRITFGEAINKKLKSDSDY